MGEKGLGEESNFGRAYMNEVVQQVPDTFNGMFLGFSVFWLAIAAYVLRLGHLLKQLEKR